MEQAIRAVDAHVLDALNADASFDMARHALKRVAEHSWWRVIES